MDFSQNCNPSSSYYYLVLERSSAVLGHVNKKQIYNMFQFAKTTKASVQ